MTAHELNINVTLDGEQAKDLMELAGNTLLCAATVVEGEAPYAATWGTATIGESKGTVGVIVIRDNEVWETLLKTLEASFSKDPTTLLDMVKQVKDLFARLPDPPEEGPDPRLN